MRWHREALPPGRRGQKGLERPGHPRYIPPVLKLPLSVPFV